MTSTHRLLPVQLLEVRHCDVLLSAVNRQSRRIPGQCRLASWSMPPAWQDKREDCMATEQATV
jgi:hypothetical protein